ncbi:MAG: DUF5615 family PIN-like protein [Acidimicrobiaceae bacterium]|nr:DUF5615 family PIN-like protein [Acidimicrobiaceae bacterium]
MASLEAQTRVRLLFDENLPWRVAAALRILQYSVSYVGDEDANPASPLRGSTDMAVLEHAVEVNQIIVTSNLDMILLCAERRQQVIWIDPWGRHLRRVDMVLLVFKNINDWIEQFENTSEPVCLRAMRTKTEILELEEARHRVRNRMGRISRKRAQTKQPRPLGGLLAE